MTITCITYCNIHPFRRELMRRHAPFWATTFLWNSMGAKT